MVIGAGIAGLRAAVGLADIGLGVYLVEREEVLGGWVGRFGTMYPNRPPRRGADRGVGGGGEETPFDRRSYQRGSSRGSEAVSATTSPRCGSTATRPRRSVPGRLDRGGHRFRYLSARCIGEYGYGIDGVLTLPELKELVDSTQGSPCYRGRPVRTVAYIYCVGSRQAGGNEYCFGTLRGRRARLDRGREAGPKVHQYHLYRDIRTYGKFELMYEESRRRAARSI